MALVNSASTARDFCMLERNVLSKLKLALLLSLLSSSLLLQARLVPSIVDQSQTSSIALASLQFLAAIACISIGLWEYLRGFQDLRIARGFLTTPKLHLIVMGTIAGAIFGTCVVFLVQDS